MNHNQSKAYLDFGQFLLTKSWSSMTWASGYQDSLFFWSAFESGMNEMPLVPQANPFVM